MKKVYILNDGGHDYADACRYGEVVICTRGSMDRWDTSQMYRQLSDVLSDANADDYIVVGGLPILCSVASAIMAERFAEVHFLLFRDGKYVERTLVLNN